MLMGTRCKTAATPPTTMNRTSWRVRISISLRNRFSNSRHTFGKLMHLLECLQALKRSVAEASTHETSIHAVVVLLFAPWSLVFEVCGHALHFTKFGRPSSTRTSRARRVVARAGIAAAQLTGLALGCPSRQIVLGAPGAPFGWSDRASENTRRADAADARGAFLGVKSASTS